VDILPALFVLTITVVAAGLLISGRLRADLVALMVLVSLGLSGIVTPAEVFTGFSGSAVMTILAISIISEALHQTGVTRRLGAIMYRWSGGGNRRLILVIILVSAGLSLFMNNIAAVGVLLPAVTSLSRQTRKAPAQLMMPLAYGVLLGGMATLLTTSNIIVSGALRDAGYLHFGLLDFLPLGLPIVVAGTAYMIFIGERLLPKDFSPGMTRRNQQLQTALFHMYGLANNLCNLAVLPGSAVAGRTLLDSQWYSRFGLTVVGLMRSGRLQMAPGREDCIEVGDIVLAQGIPAQEALDAYGLQVLNKPAAPTAVTDESVILAEVVLTPRSALEGKNLRDVHFREKYGFNVLAIWREGKALQDDLADLRLRYGDALLVQGQAAGLHLLRSEHDFIVLEEDTDPVMRPRKTWLALGITLVTMTIAALDFMPVAIVSMAGAVLLLLTNCLSMEDIYQSVEWKAIFLVAGMWPLSIAMRSSGLADGVVTGLFQIFGSMPPLGFAAILMVVTLLFTHLMGGQVASLVMAPLALAAANSIGVPPYGLAMAVALGCSLGFMTPFGHPVNLMVMSSAGYTFRDFGRVGTPITILLFLSILGGLRIFWGL